MYITSRFDGEFDYQHASDVKMHTLQFTFDQIESAWHQSGDSGQLWRLSIAKNGYTYHDIHICVTQWFKLAKYEMQRLREGQDPQRPLRRHGRRCGRTGRHRHQGLQGFVFRRAQVARNEREGVGGRG